MTSNKIDYTIDICVLLTGSGLGNKQFSTESNKLMVNIQNDINLNIAVDSRGKILHQYETKLRFGTFGREWLQYLLDNEKIDKIPYVNIDKNTRVQLINKCHFDSGVGEDFKYVITAAGTNSKILVSHDPDYSPCVKTVLRRRLNIAVKRADECI